MDALTQKDAQFIAVYGRRRVGKTYLVRECLEDRFVFAHAGVYKGDYDEHLTAFSQSLSDYGLVDFEKPKNWMEAFHLLKRVIEASPKRKKVLFLDELSWMSTRNSGLVKALEHFWNGYLSAKKDVLLVVCASATSWILSNIVHNKGGLYGRLTDEISLKPFTLKETEEYVEYRRLGYSRRQILEGYMVLGGIPFYWDKMRKGLSLASNIDRLFVGDEAPLRKEHDYLFKALFDHPEVYIKIVQALAHRNSTSLAMPFVKAMLDDLKRDHGEELSPDTLIHSDQGCHYTSKLFIETVESMELIRSMSRRGNCWDNAPQESFFGHMKDEIGDKIAACETDEEAFAIIDDWFDYYNSDRPIWGLGKMTPAEYFEQVKRTGEVIVPKKYPKKKKKDEV